MYTESSHDEAKGQKATFYAAMAFAWEPEVRLGGKKHQAICKGLLAKTVSLSDFLSGPAGKPSFVYKSDRQLIFDDERQ